MSASAKHVVRFVDVPSTGVAGRGFRGGYRPVREGAPVVVALGGDVAGLVGRVVEMSPEHLVMAWPLGRLRQARSLGRASLRVRGFEELHVEVRPGLTNLRDKPGEVGLDICAPSKALARAILERGAALVRDGLANEDTDRTLASETVEGDRLLDVLGALARNAFEGTVRAIGSRTEIAGRVTLLGGPMDGSLAWSYVGPELSGDIRIEVPGYNSVFALRSKVLRVGSGVLETTRPAALERLRHRSCRRVRASDSLVIEFNHPLWPKLAIRRAVREISAGGLSFFTCPGDDLLYPNLLAHDAVLYAGERVMGFTGEVRSITERGVDRRHACGMRVLPETAEDESVWQAVLDEHLYPTTRKGSRYAGATWELYGRAGYFDLSGKSEEEFGALRKAFASVSEKLDAAPHLGCQVVWTDDEENVEAGLSMLKTYSTAWFGYQMAKVSGNTTRGVLGRSVLRDIHLHCYEHAQRDASMRWVIGIPQVKKVWSRLVHHDLPARYVASGQAAIIRFRAIEIDCASALDVASAHDVGAATEDERAQLLETIAATRPMAYVEALDFVDERFDVSEIVDDWSLAGLDRRRAVLVARRDGVAVAGAILESAEEGSHLFRLLDSVRLFSLSGDDADDAAAYRDLLAASRAWFRSAGKTAFVAYMENDLPLPPEMRPVAVDLGLADFAILAADLVPELLEHVVEVTAPRELSSSF